MTETDLVPVGRALRQVEMISAVGLALASLEYLARPQQFEDTGLASWNIERTRSTMLASRRADFLDAIFKPPGVQIIISFRLAAALALINPRSDRLSRDAAVAFLVASNYFMATRIRLGTDGTEHMSQMTYTVLLVSRLFPNDRRVSEACAWFIAGQTNLSYLASGLAKLAGGSWRQGTAMSGIFRTYQYGDDRVHTLLHDRPALSKIAGWGVILGELATPLCLVASKKPAWALLGLGAAFHGGNAVFMGLNRFLWSFVGTYPIVAHVSKNMSIDDLSAKRLVRRLFRRAR